MPAEYSAKTEELKKFFLESGHQIDYNEDELSGALVWTFITLNMPFGKFPDQETVARYFCTGKKAFQDISETVISTFSIFDKRFLLKQTCDEIALHSMKLPAKSDDMLHGIEHFFDKALELYDQESNLKALCSFLTLFDFICGNENSFSTEDILGFTLALLSNIGHIYWDENVILQAKHAFRNGVHIIHAAFDNPAELELDCRDKNQLSILFIIEDYASVEYASGNLESAKEYFGLLQKLDRENRLQADTALSFISRGAVWNEYVDFLDSITDEDQESASADK
jgi:hypothetical protein